MTDTLGVVTPQPKGLIPPDDADRLRAALAALEASRVELRAAVVDAAKHGASVRELAEFTGLSTNTISRWKRES